MSRSILKDKYMKRCYVGQSYKQWKWDDPIRNPHRQDEMPKNSPSKLVLIHCHGHLKINWITGSFRGHSCSPGAHRQIRGLVRASLKREGRKLMLEQLAEFYEESINQL